MDNIKPTSKKLKDLLDGFEENLKKLYAVPTEDILKFWPKIVGDNISKMTKAIEFREGVLVVKVNNSSLYSLLTVHEKPRLVNVLRKQFPSVKIKTIHFRLG